MSKKEKSLLDGMNQMLGIAKKAARTGGEILQREYGKLRQKQIGLKGMGDYVTELDHRSEEAIVQIIRTSFPNHDIYAEERGEEKRRSPYRWLIDPLDGTANYVQGIPIYGVSIGLMKAKDILLGVVYVPSFQEMYWAIQGKGSFLNGKPISVSAKNELAYSMLASGFPWRSKPYLDAYLDSFRRLFFQSAGIRRMGSASIDLAYTACGRFDGFWEMKLKPYDIAAGILLVLEAGGTVTDFQGRRNYFRSGNVLASNPVLHPKMLAIIQKYLSEVP